MFSLVNYNIRSYRKNIDSFIPIIDKNLPNVLMFTETWFTENYQANLQNYQAFHTVRPIRLSGGTSIYVRNDLNATQLNNFSYVSINIEVNSVKVNLNKEEIIIVAVYRPHGGTIQGFTEELERIIHGLNLGSRRCLLAGDFNIRLEQDSTENSIFTESMRSQHFFPVITKPTRFPPDNRSSPSLLDLIWTNSLNVLNSGIVYHDTTDHCPTFIQLPIINNSVHSDNDFVKISFRLNNTETRESFSRAVASFNWPSLASDDINTFVSDFTSTLNNMYCANFPLKTKNISKKQIMNPWCTPEIRKLIHNKSEYFKLLQIGSVSKEENNTYKNRVKSVISTAKRNYYNNLFAQNFDNIRKTWKTINFLIGTNNRGNSIKKLILNGVEYSDDSSLAEIFSDHFSSISAALQANIPRSYRNAADMVGVHDFEPFFLDPCTPDECSAIIDAMKITNEGKNNLPIRLLKANKDIFSPVISEIVNQSISTGVFPDQLKIATVIPVFKKGDPTNPSNYRPISLLPFMSKILEKIICVRLTNFFYINSIITPHQFGFQKNLSTIDAIIHFSEIVYNGLNDKNSIICIFIDFCKAFDSVMHSILLKKLEAYGVTGIANQLIASFLGDRRQMVRVGNVFSRVETLNIGVPQGSILGPLLFLVFINDLPTISNHFTPTMFADDCTLQFCGSNIDDLINSCNDDLRKLLEWTHSNKLTINTDKTYCMLMSNVTNTLPTDSINILEESLSLVLETKFLGLTLDHKLKFDKHIKCICTKISKSIGVLFKLREVVPLYCLKTIFYSLIHPYILYCLPVFAATSRVHLQPLVVLQKRAIRLINGAGYLDTTDPLFYASGILKIEDQYKHCLGVYLYKNPEIANNYRRTHNFNTRNQDNLLPPFERLRSTQQSVIYNAVSVWNTVPKNIKDCISLASYKYNYKMFLLENYGH